ncbi:2,3-diaminopropionate biosynthesis protein SbnA [Gimesia fumaroli]|uniref:N-(2-amino-2-carboxyethyl)-L-glutamate synthase n=1 Tax=Gimesia fumaroli TaxID=2527976 RepID=A0A518I4I3_9PLAN|nr:2,3-diaminopropionate biosynthesis protein SbnA [Gimesia fumaroli]QDV48002.1 putative siderophore biosynthesis protein SbnA [Gimesia fumaroli]
MIEIQQNDDDNNLSKEGVLDTIGATPLINLRRYLGTADVQLYAKMEAFNPGGSAKDRPARAMIEEALESGTINKNTTIIESTSGNMGIGLAQACCYYGLPLICVVDPHAQEQNIAIMKAYGAVIERVERPLQGAFLKARLARVMELLNQFPDSFWPNQYSNEKNPLAHENGTIQEIDEALNGELDYLFVATSSTGTARGCQEYLKKRGRSTKVIAVDAEGSVLFGGLAGRRRIPGLGAGHVPALAAGQEFDDVKRVSDLDCVVGCRRMVKYEAILVGGSAGGVLEAIRSMIPELRTKVSAAILHDSGTRYLDTIYSDQWVERELGCSAEELQARIEQPSSVGVTTVQKEPRFTPHLMEQTTI